MNTFVIIYLIGVLINLLLFALIFYKEYQENSQITLFKLIIGCVFACGSFPNLVILIYVLDSEYKDVIIFKKK